ncbi:MAG: transglycosylase SLT domain-containing protein [Nitrospirae bacterium]|nr:transglycosylase SLT domain-containing protein [Nitrospirota bacterium]
MQDLVAKLFPVCDWRLIQAQIRQESNFNPKALSPCGARGLLQLMPATAEEMGYTAEELWDPRKNLSAGIKFLRDQYRCFAEIPDHNERLKFALAAYNGGRGYVNAALRLAYEFELKEPMRYKALKSGQWQKWEFTKEKLKTPSCFVMVGGVKKHPDWRQILGYVAAIWKTYERGRS